MKAFYVKYDARTGKTLSTVLQTKGYAIPISGIDCDKNERVVRFLIGDGVDVTREELEDGTLERLDYPRLLRVKDGLTLSEPEYAGVVSLRIPDVQ